MDRRLTTVESQLLNVVARLDEHITLERAERKDLMTLMDRLDARQDKNDVLMARFIGGLIVAQFLAILFAPVIRAALGLAGS